MHVCFVLFPVCVCVCVCVCVFVAISVSRSLVGAIDGAENAHPLGTPAREMVKTAQQPAGWWILATRVKFTGFLGVTMYTY